jgi:phosphohistidine phosphatase
MSSSYALYLVRHADAADAGTLYPDDAMRPVSPEGAEKFQGEIGALNSLDAKVEIVYTSPLLRCRQTAEMLAGSYPTPPPVQTTDALAPGGTFTDLVNAIGRSGQEREIALVGHEPGLGALAARLIGAASPFHLKKGGVCRIDIDSFPPEAPGELRWFLTPKAMRLIAKSGS